MSLYFQQIAKAIEYIKDHAHEQPSLESIAESVHMSPFHFQKIFTQWAGVSPKKFLKFLNISYAKKMLLEDNFLSIAHKTGLSSTGRLYDLFVTIEGMTPGEYKNGGAGLEISYCFEETPFGFVIIGSTSKGICHISYADSLPEGLEQIKQRFENAVYTHGKDELHEQVLRMLRHESVEKIKLHLRGTPFQLKVWEALLHIPEGRLTTYGHIASAIGHQKAHRAVGTAVGQNPVAYLIPCHRVIQASGILGNYHWDPKRKTAMIAWEISRTKSIT
ncbi:MAG: methylated-DNA--[protein]-cysteine S-methyltransferase [Candidatus Gracilibacteria bacterium]